MKEIRKKILTEYFKEVKNGNKNFELRKDEDNIQVGDELVLEEWTGGDIFTAVYTGMVIRKTVKYVLRNVPEYGLMDGYCIIGF